MAFAVLTDVDGCVLDARTYEWGPARGVLRRLHRRGIPVVLCTSKTRAEVAALYAELGHRLLAVIEGGGAILVPPGILPEVPARARRSREGWLVALVTPYPRVRAALRELRRLTGGAVRGFGDMTAREVAALTGLSLAAARRARAREFDEPFVFVEGDARRHRRALRQVSRRHGLRCARGGQLFYHLHGPTDKGRAVRRVKRWLRALHGPLRTVALGDGPHDLPLLREGDIPVIVPRPDGTPDPVLLRRCPGARLAPAPGPKGWAAAVSEFAP